MSLMKNDWKQHKPMKKKKKEYQLFLNKERINNKFLMLP